MYTDNKVEALKAAAKGEMGSHTNSRNRVIDQMILFAGGDWKTILKRAKELKRLLPLLKETENEYMMVSVSKKTLSLFFDFIIF